MIFKFVLLCCLAVRYSKFCCGSDDIPFFDDSTGCFDKVIERDEIPFYEFERQPFSLEKRMNTVFYPDPQIPSSYLRPFAESNEQDIQYMTQRDSTESQLHHTKRSITSSKENTKINSDEHDQYETGYLSPLTREIRDKGNPTTIYLHPALTPRLGRKRSEEIGNPSDNDNYRIKSISGRSRVIDLKAGTAFTPRLGRSEVGNKLHLFAGNTFTPRLGRSEGFHTVRFNAGSAFTPRLGRSDHPNRVLLNAGGAFTPRLGRSDDNRIHLNAGSAFTPRLGRSNDNRIHRIHLNAGGTFTPRPGRSDANRIHLNAGSAFTPRLGRSGDSKMFLNDGSSIILD